MKRISTSEFLFQTKLKRLLSRVKITVLLIFVCSLQLSAHVWSQNANLQLSLKNTTLRKAIEEIEKQSEYRFLFHDQTIDSEMPVTIQVNGTIEEVLKELFKDNSMEYNLLGNNLVVISPKPAPQQQQQPGAVTGKVTDPSGSPLPGVTVIIKGTSQGTITGADGSFSIASVPANAIITFSFVGMRPLEVEIAGKRSFNISMEEETIGLDEVVAIGYGTQRKGDVTSSVASVKQDGFLKGAVKDPGQLIQGQIAGLTITMPNGDPTGSTQIMLRGNTTILGASSNPLILIDGVPGDFNTVAPEDIESVDVLKDGSAAAIYGSRGTNGVVIITTKKSKGNNINEVEYTGYISTSTIAKRLEMMNAQEYIEYAGSAWDLGGDTDWFEEITRTPVSHVHNISLKGGSSERNYVANLNYRQTQGIFKKSDMERFQGRIEVNHNMFNNKLKLNFGIIGNQRSYTSTVQDGSWNTYAYRQSLIHNPTQPLRDENGNWTQQTGLFEYSNPMAILYETDGKKEYTQTRFNGNITFNPIRNLTLKALFSWDKEHKYSGYYETRNHFSTLSSGLNGYAYVGSSTNRTKLMELTAQYNKEIKEHNFSILAGYSWQGTDYGDQYQTNYDFPTDVGSYNNIGLGNAAKEGMGTNYSYALKTNLISFFGRLSYSFKNRYMLMASLRYEAASQLAGTEDPWGTFPSMSIGWRITEEEFMSGQGIFNDLKLRAGYGVTGTQPSNSFLGMSLLNYGTYFYYNGTWIQSLEPSQNANPHLKWEEKHETNIGMDFSVLNDRLGGSIDYYYREIRDLLYDYSVPSPPNLYGTTRANVGVMTNTGLEVLLTGTPVKTENFIWSATVTFSTNKNKLKSLSNQLYEASADYFVSGWIQEPVKVASHIVQVGQAIGNFHGYKVIDADDDGKWIYKDSDGNAVPYDDFSHAFADRHVIGNGLPKYYAGWNNNLRYKTFDLSIAMRGAFDYQIINGPRMFYENRVRSDWNRLKSANDLIFGKTLLNSTVSEEFNSYYVENGDHWKIDNITLGYTLRDFSSRYVKSIRLYASCLNTLTITNYKGTDPEVSRSGLNPGYDNRDTYPNIRSFSFGVNLSF